MDDQPNTDETSSHLTRPERRRLARELRKDAARADRQPRVVVGPDGLPYNRKARRRIDRALRA